MRFLLNYYGNIKSNGSTRDKHEIRIAFHEQMKKICSLPQFDETIKINDGMVSQANPPYGAVPMYRTINGNRYRFLICEDYKTVVDLEVILIVPHKVGAIINTGGDIDNRIKTLFDALRAPLSKDEIPSGDTFVYNNDGMYCLLEDDKLIESVKISAYEDYAAVDKTSVKTIIIVNTRITAALNGNAQFV